MSRVLRAVIADGEPLARERIRSLLSNESDIEVMCECRNGGQALRAIVELSPDLVFLDIQMPELDGLGVVEALRGLSLPAIIFVTAYDEYALKAFEVHALDYLLKPFDRDRFARAIVRARHQLLSTDRADVEQRLLSMLRTLQLDKQYLARFVVKTNGRIVFVKVEDVDWIEAQGNYVLLHAAKQAHLLRETMTNVEKHLDPAKFLRIHRSLIVSLDHVREMRPLFQGEYLFVMRDGRELTSGRAFRHRLQRFITTYGR